jgi:LPS sulfotransferase NodH
MSDAKAYVICTSPRSGSTMLCGMLEATGQAGSPDSHFHVPSLDAWIDEYGLAPDPGTSMRDRLDLVLAAAVTRGRGATAMFGLRLQQDSLDHFLSMLGIAHPGVAGGAASIEAAFGRTRYLHLTRRDRLGQAISHLIATQTGLWHRNADGSELERLAEPAAPVYDPDVIRALIARAEARDLAWNRWFVRERIKPLRLTYEVLSADPQGVLGCVLAHLGLDPALAATVAPPTARLADATSDDWRARFLSDGGA